MKTTDNRVRIVKKKTCQSGKRSMVKMSSMPKASKSSYKKYRGQGR